MPTMYAALWTRPSTGSPSSAGRTVAQGFEQLKKALAAAVKRIDSDWIKLPEKEQQKRLKGVFLAPEYYFANAEMGSWDSGSSNFRTRPIEQNAKEALMLDLITLSKRYPDYLFVPGSVAWRKPLDRPDSEKRKKNPLTGLRTGPLKTEDRRTKAKNVVGASGANWKMGRQPGLPPDGFEQAVWDAICDRLKGGLPCPYNLRPVFDDEVNDGYTEPQAFERVVASVRRAPYGQAICDWAGLPRMSYIPKKSEKVGAITSGTATHLMRNTAFVLHGGRVVFKYNKRGDFHECIGDGKTVFKPGEGLGKTDPIHGVTFGLEICLDHALGVLHTGVSGDLPDIHIVISDSVQNNPAHMKAKQYYLHASTNQNSACVLAAPSWTPADSVKLSGQDSVDGGTINYWKLNVNV